ncbi:MAG: hypothetical protein ACJZ10_06830 [Candidatus Neomarinimicrobiota bacterium]
MKISRMGSKISFFLLTAFLFGETAAYVYVLPFDNIQNDPALDWISSGLSDMTREEIKNVYGVRLKSREDLEVIMNDRSLMLKQPRGSRNILVLGKYSRQLDKINVTIQIVDVANWEELGKSNISEVYSKVQALNQSVGRAVIQMISPFLPKQPVQNSSPFPAYTEPENPVKRNPISIRSEKLASNLDSQIADLEASMEYLLGAKARKEEKPKKDVPRFSSGEWTMDFDVDKKNRI